MDFPERSVRAERAMQTAEAAVRNLCENLDEQGIPAGIACGALLHAGIVDLGFLKLNPDQQFLLCETLEDIVRRIREIHDEFGLP